MVATLVSRIVGMLRDSIIAGQLGLTVQADAYTAAFRVPDLLYYLVAGGAISSTFVPVFVEYIDNGNKRAAWKTFSVVATLIVIIGVFLIALCEFNAFKLVHLLNPKSSMESLLLATKLTKVLLPAQIFFMLGGLLMGAQNAWGKYLNAALAPTIYNIGIIFGALFLTHTRLGITGLVWGAVTGAFVGNFFLQLFPVMRLGMQFRPSLAVFHPGVVRVGKMMLPILLGASLPNVDQQINSYFASQLPGGSRAAIMYANRIMLIPIGIFAQAMGQAILPSLSSMANQRNFSDFRSTLNKGIRTIAFLTIPSSALLYLLSVPLIGVLLHHAHFHQSDVVLVARPLEMYTIGIFAWSAQAILTRCFYALQDSKTPVISGTILSVVFIGMNWIVVHGTHTGIAGLAFATSLAAMAHTAIMMIILHRRLKGLQNRKLIQSLLRTSIATAALGVAVWLTCRILELFVPPSRSTLGSLLWVTVGGGVGLVTFIAVSAGLKAPEMSVVTSIAAKLRSRISARKT